MESFIMISLGYSTYAESPLSTFVCHFYFCIRILLSCHQFLSQNKPSAQCPPPSLFLSMLGCHSRLQRLYLHAQHGLNQTRRGWGTRLRKSLFGAAGFIMARVSLPLLLVVVVLL